MSQLLVRIVNQSVIIIISLSHFVIDTSFLLMQVYYAGSSKNSFVPCSFLYTLYYASSLKHCYLSAHMSLV